MAPTIIMSEKEKSDILNNITRMDEEMEHKDREMKNIRHAINTLAGVMNKQMLFTDDGLGGYVEMQDLSMPIFLFPQVRAL